LTAKQNHYNHNYIFVRRKTNLLAKTYLITNQLPKHQGGKSAPGSSIFFWAAEPGHWLGGPAEPGHWRAAPLPDGRVQVNDVLGRHPHMLFIGKSQGMFASPAFERRRALALEHSMGFEHPIRL